MELKYILYLTLISFSVNELNAKVSEHPLREPISVKLTPQRDDEDTGDDKRYRSSSSESLSLPDTLLPGTNYNLANLLNLGNTESLINQFLSLLSTSNTSSSSNSASVSSSEETILDLLNTFVVDLNDMKPNKKSKKRYDYVRKICSDKIYKNLTCKNFTTIWPSHRNNLSTPKMYYVMTNLSTMLSFYDAAHFCVLNGMDLVSIEDINENNLLKRILYHKLGITTTSAPSDNNAVLIGLTVKPTDGKRYWLSTGQSPNFTDWASGQPGSASGTTECTYFYQPTTYEFQWFSGTCNRPALFICEAPDECALAIGKKLKRAHSSSSSSSSSASSSEEARGNKEGREDDNVAKEVTDEDAALIKQAI